MLLVMALIPIFVSCSNYDQADLSPVVTYPDYTRLKTGSY